MPEVYRHVNSGNDYEIVGTALNEKDLAEMVLYRTLDRQGPVWARAKAEFFDGRFQAVNQRPLVVYHKGCTDGFAAALAFWMIFKDGADYHPGVYGEPPPDVAGRLVYLVDFSYDVATVQAMVEKAKSVTWVDHHVSAFEALKDVEGLIKHYDVNKSGCVLAWELCHPLTRVPDLFQMIQDRDLWRFELQGSKEVTAYLYTKPFDFKEWSLLLNTELSGVISVGEVLLKKQDSDVARLTAEFRIQQWSINGIPVPAVNANSMFASDIGSKLSEEAPFAVVYVDDATHRTYSLRSNKEYKDCVDVSMIASEFGGGGHKHAASFRESFDSLSNFRV